MLWPIERQDAFAFPMLIRLLLAAVLLALFFTFMQRWKRSNPEEKKALRRNLLIAGAVTLLLLLTVTGKIQALTALVLAILSGAFRAMPLLLRYLPFLRRIWSGYQQNGALFGQGLLALRMGRQGFDAEIKQGPLAGRLLSDLQTDDLLSLWRFAQQSHPKALPLLNMYLNRRLGPDWQQQAGEQYRYTPNNSGAMTVDEACDILGVPADASTDDIRKAHKRLMQKVHPDRGGSDYLAARVNEAKAVLLARHKK